MPVRRIRPGRSFGSAAITAAGIELDLGTSAGARTLVLRATDPEATADAEGDEAPKKPSWRDRLRDAKDKLTGED